MRWLEPGRLLAGEYPGATTSEKAREKVRLLIDAAVDSIVDLTTPDDHLSSYREALELVATQAGRQIRHVAHPIPGMSVIDHDGYDRILARIRDETNSGRVVYLHCWFRPNQPSVSRLPVGRRCSFQCLGRFTPA